MAAQEDKERKLPQPTPASTGNTTKDTGAKPDAKKDPDLYDPVGMAGKKAGIVEEIEQEIKQERDAGSESGKDSSN